MHSPIPNRCELSLSQCQQQALLKSIAINRKLYLQARLSSNMRMLQSAILFTARLSSRRALSSQTTCAVEKLRGALEDYRLRKCVLVVMFLFYWWSIALLYVTFATGHRYVLTTRTRHDS